MLIVLMDVTSFKLIVERADFRALAGTILVPMSELLGIVGVILSGISLHLGPHCKARVFLNNRYSDYPLQMSHVFVQKLQVHPSGVIMRRMHWDSISHQS